MVVSRVFNYANPSIRFHSYFAPQHDVSFSNGDPLSWDWVSDPQYFWLRVKQRPSIPRSFASDPQGWRHNVRRPPAYLADHGQWRLADLS